MERQGASYTLNRKYVNDVIGVQTFFQYLKSFPRCRLITRVLTMLPKEGRKSSVYNAAWWCTLSILWWISMLVTSLGCLSRHVCRNRMGWIEGGLWMLRLYRDIFVAVAVTVGLLLWNIVVCYHTIYRSSLQLEHKYFWKSRFGIDLCSYQNVKGKNNATFRFLTGTVLVLIPNSRFGKNTIFRCVDLFRKNCTLGTVFSEQLLK